MIYERMLGIQQLATSEMKPEAWLYDERKIYREWKKREKKEKTDEKLWMQQKVS